MSTHKDCLHFIEEIKACDILAHNMDMRGQIIVLNPDGEGCEVFRQKEKKDNTIRLLKTPIRELHDSQLKWLRQY